MYHCVVDAPRIWELGVRRRCRRKHEELDDKGKSISNVGLGLHILQECMQCGPNISPAQLVTVYQRDAVVMDVRKPVNECALWLDGWTAWGRACRKEAVSLTQLNEKGLPFRGPSLQVRGGSCKVLKWNIRGKHLPIPQEGGSACCSSASR